MFIYYSKYLNTFPIHLSTEIRLILQSTCGPSYRVQLWLFSPCRVRPHYRVQDWRTHPLSPTAQTGVTGHRTQTGRDSVFLVELFAAEGAIPLSISVLLSV